MFAGKKTAKRFSLLLLEDDEHYVQDWIGLCKWPKEVSGNWSQVAELSGRLRLCTKSMYFEPDDVRVPIVRLPFDSIQQLELCEAKSFMLATNQVVKMKVDLQDTPYVFERGPLSTWFFTLPYAPTNTFMMAAQAQLLTANMKPNDRLEAVEAAVKRQADGQRFDSSRLVDFSEHVLWDSTSCQLTPLVKEVGRLVITEYRLYFQPLHNVSGDVPVRSHPLQAVAAVARRRSSLRPLGLEVFFLDQSTVKEAGGDTLAGPFWEGPSAFFEFRTQEDREGALKVLLEQKALGTALAHKEAGAILSSAALLMEPSGGDLLMRVTAAWQHAKISNFDYLLYLNLVAGRSFNDLAQWPVFPWVLNNYTSAKLDLLDLSNFRDLSKPIGALNPERLGVFRSRYKSMKMDGGMPPFMYGTHYSTPGYVMYWLVRAAPGHMLRLQGGRFDAPDRLFFSVSDAWEGVLGSTSDVKELIPEFFLPSEDFLVNSQQLPLGTRQCGRRVGDVELPRWASSPADFLAKHRCALESPYVSANLHHWVDLIFGYKQKGAAAEEADNVFYYLTYEGAVDISKVTHAAELKALETQINEFGQTPQQLFHSPHPPRLVHPPPPSADMVFTTSMSLDRGRGRPLSGRELRGSRSRLRGAGEEAGGRLLTLALLASVLAATSTPVQEVKEVNQGLMGSAGQSGGEASTSLLGVPGPASNGLGRSVNNVTASTASMTMRGASKGLTVDEDGFLLSPPRSPSSHSSPYLNRGPNTSALPSKASIALSPVTTTPAALQSSISHSAIAPPAGSTGAAPGSLEASAGRRAPRQALPGEVDIAPASMSEYVEADVAGSMAQDTGAPDQSRTAAEKVSGPSRASSKSSSQGKREAPSSSQDSAGSHQAGTMALFKSYMQTTVQKISDTAVSASSSILPRTLPSPGKGVASIMEGPQASSSPEPGPTLRTSSSFLRWMTSTPSDSEEGPSPRKNNSGESSNLRRAQDTLYPGASCNEGWWGPALPGTLGPLYGSSLSKDSLSAVGISSVQGGSVYCVGAEGLLKVLSLRERRTVRSAKLPGDLLSLWLLSETGGPGRHPLMVLGSHHQLVHVYAAEAARHIGSYLAHEDAVSCLWGLSSGGGPVDRLVTASWDCTMKVWSLAEGREPWSRGSSTVAILPDQEQADLDSGVWAMVGDPQGTMVVAGTEEGAVACWDLRCASLAWQTTVSQDYVGGVGLHPAGDMVLAAHADGGWTLLDCRRPSEPAASVSCGMPLRCCTTDGRLAMAGAETGELLFWDIAQASGRGAPAQLPHLPSPNPEGLYPSLKAPSSSSVNALCVGQQATDGEGLVVATAQEDGYLTLYGERKEP